MHVPREGQSALRAQGGAAAKDTKPQGQLIEEVDTAKKALLEAGSEVPHKSLLL